MKIRTYHELRSLTTFMERYDYLRLKGRVGQDTFGLDRVFNQMFYKSAEWQRLRRDIIARDNGCDLGIEGREINFGKIVIHHMNPITLTDIEEATDYLLNPEYLICTSYNTHNAIHYGSRDILIPDPIDVARSPNDTCPWKK